MINQALSSSFRDPSGFVYKNKNGEILRQINHVYSEHYDCLMQSGLYKSLTNKKMLIEHEEVIVEHSDTHYKTIKPEQLPYISYPYEWCFSQLQDAALLTLQIQLEALDNGMTLKDASAYNVQFYKGRPVFIDTLSFESYQDNQPWVAYKQFCQHFLAPLCLASHADFRLTTLLKHFIDGIPLDLVSSILPRTTWLNYSLLAHIHLHARTQQKYNDTGISGNNPTQPKVSKIQLVGLINSLLSAIKKLKWRYTPSEWGQYYEATNYTEDSMSEKERLVGEFLDDIPLTSDFALVADFGANTGRFSDIAAKHPYLVLAHDIDAVAVEAHYLGLREAKKANVLPLLQNLENPNPSIGWANEERSSFIERNNLYVGLALAVIHHICISNNIPLELVARFFKRTCENLIIEFVPKSDSQVKRLLATRTDIFTDYDLEAFVAAFEKHFKVLKSRQITGSERTLFLMTRLD